MRNDCISTLAENTGHRHTQSTGNGFFFVFCFFLQLRIILGMRLNNTSGITGSVKEFSVYS